MKLPLDSASPYYPKSFLKLLLLAFGLVALPLVLAFVNAAVYVDRLSEQSRSAVGQAAQAARGSRLLMEQVTMLERVMRQYLILSDAELLDDYAKLRRNFKATTSELSLLPLDELQLHKLNLAIEKEQVLYDAMSRRPANGADKTALVGGYVELSDLARDMLNISNDLIDREVERLSQTAERAQRILLWQFAATIPIGVALAVGVTLLVASPIRQIDAAVRKLGRGEFEGDIRVRGPADLEYLGSRLDWLRRRLIELEEEKARFLRHITHELKTPLTALREGSELLADGTAGSLGDSQREIATILRDKSVQLQKLIEDLLQYQRARDGLARLALAPARLDQIVARVIDDHRLAADARSLRIEAKLDPAELQADVDKLRVVADNLLSNALKYSASGSIVSLVVACDTDNVTLDVRDGGPGIVAANRERVFDWFFQDDSGHHGRVAGSGLGLAITRELVLAHRGNIKVVDDGAPGAHFRVTLPVRQNA